MSISRQIRRRTFRLAGKEWPGAEPRYKLLRDGVGYSVVHPTKGWRRHAAARLRAQSRLRNLIERIDRRMGWS